MPRRFGPPIRQYLIPRHPILDQEQRSRDYCRFDVKHTENDQMTRRFEQADYSRKDFNRVAGDLHSYLEEALEFFRKIDTEFTIETKEIKKYGDAELLDMIWEKKILRFENGPRAPKPSVENHLRSDQRYPRNQNDEPGSIPARQA